MPKIESDNIEISLRPVDLDTCLEEVASTCRNLVSQNGNEFILEKSADLGIIDTDETRLRQILINLLGNAGKFTKNGKVALRANRVSTATGDQIVMAVADTGIGISRGGGRRPVHRFQSSQLRDIEVIRRNRLGPRGKPPARPVAQRRHRRGKRAWPRIEYSPFDFRPRPAVAAAA